MNIPSTIKLNAQVIIDNLSQESIDTFVFLEDQFKLAPDIRENYLFHFVYRSFYRLDNAGLSNEMKLEYFKLMQELRDKEEFDFSLVCGRLYEIPNIKGQNSLQFSFATKMANMISPIYPIYDSEVATMFGFRAPYGYKPYDQRFAEYRKFYNDMSEGYVGFSDSEILEGVLWDLESKRNNIKNLSTIKKLDFLMWSAGKLQKSGKLTIA